MVRGLSTAPDGLKKLIMFPLKKSNFCSSIYPIILFLILLPIISVPAVFSAEEVNPPKKSSVKSPEPQKASPSPSPSASGAAAETPFITLKVMVVNPSAKFKQIFPMKAYLPEEVKEGHILDKEDLEIGYDEVKKSYFLSKEIELEPGQSVVKVVRVEDIWFIPLQKLEDLSDDAHDLYKKLMDTPYSEQGRLLLNNIEVLLMQITERQNDKTVTPQEHISIFRDNKKRVGDIEMDLMSLRRFLTAASGSGGFFGLKKSSNGKMPKILEDMAKKNGESTISAQVLWKIIFSILIFIGAATLLFLSVWQHQIRSVLSRTLKRIVPEKQSSAAQEKMKIGDFYPGLSDQLPKEGPVEGISDSKNE